MSLVYFPSLVGRQTHGHTHIHTRVGPPLKEGNLPRSFPLGLYNLAPVQQWENRERQVVDQDKPTRLGLLCSFCRLGTIFFPLPFPWPVVTFSTEGKQTPSKQVACRASAFERDSWTVPVSLFTFRTWFYSFSSTKSSIYYRVCVWFVYLFGEFIHIFYSSIGIERYVF